MDMLWRGCRGNSPGYCLAWSIKVDYWEGLEWRMLRDDLIEVLNYERDRYDRE